VLLIPAIGGKPHSHVALLLFYRVLAVLAASKQQALVSRLWQAYYGTGQPLDETSNMRMS